MAKKTKSEITRFLNSQVGDKVNAKCGIYNGQCVSLIKALLEFIGAPDPYSARGNAKDVGDTLLRQNIAENGKGWLTVVINKDMGYIGGVHYGHIWVDLKSLANYEQNGAVALHTTKNTRPLSQGQQFVNLDKWIKEANVKVADASAVAYIIRVETGNDATKAQIDKYKDKYTFSKLRDIVNDWDSAKTALKRAKAGTLKAQDHLTLPLRTAYVAPVAPGAKELPKGLYEVK